MATRVLTVVQKLELLEFPPGLSMTITNVVPSFPPDEHWEVEFACQNGQRVSMNTCVHHDPYHNNLRLPITVPLSVGENSTIQGSIGVVKFGGYGGQNSSGSGGQVVITIRIQGSVTVNGTSRTIDETAYIGVSTSRWKAFKRPDYTNISYSRGNADPIHLSLRVPEFSDPAPACFSYQVTAEGPTQMVLTGSW